MKKYLITKATIIHSDGRRDLLTCNILTQDITGIETERKRLKYKYQCYTVHFRLEEVHEQDVAAQSDGINTIQ